MKSSVKILAFVALVIASGSLAQARDHGHHFSGGGGHLSFGVGVYGAPYYYGGYAPYYYQPYYYSVPSVRSYSYEGTGYDLGLGADVQRQLARRGYYYGGIDGVIGPMSRDAIRRYQAARGLPVTGGIDSRLLRSLDLD